MIYEGECYVLANRNYDHTDNCYFIYLDGLASSARSAGEAAGKISESAGTAAAAGNTEYLPGDAGMAS